MLTIEKLKETFHIITEKPVEQVKQMVDEIESHLKENPWPMGTSKDFVIDGLQALYDAKVPVEAMNPFQLMTDIMEGKSRKLPELSDEIKEQIKRYQKLVEEAKTVVCDHKDLVIAPFLHGGGFTPILAHPELICLECGLNVTLHALRKGVKNPSKVYEKNYGLTIADKDGVKKLFKWVGNGEEYGGRHDLKNVEFSDHLTRDPQRMYEKSANKWIDPIPFKVVNKEILEALSGS